MASHITTVFSQTYGSELPSGKLVYAGWMGLAEPQGSENRNSAASSKWHSECWNPIKPNSYLVEHFRCLGEWDREELQYPPTWRTAVCILSLARKGHCGRGVYAAWLVANKKVWDLLCLEC